MNTSTSCLEGEIDGIVEMKANNSPKVSDPLNKFTSSWPAEMPAPCTPLSIPSPSPAVESIPEELPAEKCVHKPSQHIINLLEGHGHTSNCSSDPVVTHGIQVPSTVTEASNIALEGEGQ